MERKRNITKNLIIILTAVFVGAVLMYGLIYMYPQRFSTEITKVQKDVTVTETGIADAVEKIYDAVVVVSTYKDSKLVSSGTGFVFKKDGDTAYILTNNHVINSGNKVTVKFTNESVIETKIIGSDTYSDIAVLSIKAEDATVVAEIGSNSSSRIGDTVFAVGAPINSIYSWTVTRGILSGKDRMMEVSTTNNQQADYVMKVLQTDAAINSGNSGGPLCNSNGQVIGITSLKLVSSGIEGMGFAIPIEDAVETAETIISGGKRETPYLGITMVDISTAYYYREYYNLIQESGVTKGVIVHEVEKNSAAEKAGLQTKDIITKIGDIEVSSIAYLRYALFQYKVGDKVNVTFYRDGQPKNVTVELKSNKSTT